MAARDDDSRKNVEFIFQTFDLRNDVWHAGYESFSGVRTLPSLVLEPSPFPAHHCLKNHSKPFKTIQKGVYQTCSYEVSVGLCSYDDCGRQLGAVRVPFCAVITEFGHLHCKEKTLVL